MEPKITYKKVKVDNSWKLAVEVWRVKYGKKNTPIDEREYQLYNGSPVGTIKELSNFIDDLGNPEIEGILLCDPISNCTHFVVSGEENLINLNIRGK